MSKINSEKLLEPITIIDCYLFAKAIDAY